MENVPPNHAPLLDLLRMPYLDQGASATSRAVSKHDWISAAPAVTLPANPELLTMSKKLSKELGLLHVFAISTGAMISSGLFVLPGIAAAKVGPVVVYIYLLSGLLLLPSLCSSAELATAMPRAGGTYFFISRSLGSMFGTIDGVGVWLALILKTAISLIGLGAYLQVYLNLPMEIIALGFCVIFMVANLLGTKEAAGLQVAMVALLVGVLGFFIVRGVPQIDAANMQPMMPFGARPLLPTTAFVFISYIGVTKIASVSEEVRRPERNIPLGMILSLGLVLVIYGLAVWILVGVLSADELHNSLTPLSDAARKTSGSWGAHAVALGAIMAFATTANAGILSASRYILAMSRDNVIPHSLSHFSRYRTPKNAILVTSAVTAAVVLAAGIEQIAKLASTFQLLEFALVNVAVIVMRESRIESYDPGFRSPFYPFVQIAGVFISVVLISEMGIGPSMFAMGLVSLGVIWHYLYVRHRVSRVGAVAKVAERVAENLLERDAQALGLKRELREILKEKGLRSDDPFARMVEEAEFIELGPKSSPEDAIRRGSELLAKRSGIHLNTILDGLLERNRLGETPAGAGVALPHLLLEEVDRFYMVIARSIYGLDFAMSDQGIHAVFILLGSRGNPTRHLRFLASIARRAEDPSFTDCWIGAETGDDLKQILLEPPSV